jgi:hypothetical protein
VQDVIRSADIGTAESDTTGTEAEADTQAGDSQAADRLLAAMRGTATWSAAATTVYISGAVSSRPSKPLVGGPSTAPVRPAARVGAGSGWLSRILRAFHRAMRAIGRAFDRGLVECPPRRSWWAWLQPGYDASDGPEGPSARGPP